MINLDGNELSSKKKEALKEKIEKLPIKPQLAIVRIGEDSASDIYVEKKVSFGREAGVEVGVLHLPSDTTTEKVQEEITALNDDRTIQGIIVQLPVPESIDRETVINVDGLTAINMWRLMDDASGIVPATAKGIESLLDEHSIDLSGSHVVIVGDSLLVGKSVGIQFLNKDATVTICHDKTKNLSEFTKQADILIVAVGKPNLISNLHTKQGQIIVDVGINRKEDGSVVGDVDFDSVKDIVGAITPVPGGVGPMTVVSLFENLVDGVKV
ncbi:bifunctional methylenetetrahydrofolate dehydrogenase/methenyltetrahydrofolate cyclohydrolase [Candidatus Pacebacteria bacterium]|nr:bifunctional methylenetetrahydrofolate dehydrogenase/methenyltetrahydrofolate cyclohydrolase [Candidatus Paceibacterota bacterium]